MRLWSWQLLPYLSDLQFKGQLRELTAIMRDWRDKGTTNHLLINRVMDYPKFDLCSYFMIYAREYQKRYNKRLNSQATEFSCFLNFDEIPEEFVIREKPGIREITYNKSPFHGWHNKEYLRACMANLYEKHFFGVGKSRITDEEWNRLCEGYKAIAGEDYVI